MELNEMRRIAEAATPGPWEARQGAVAPGKKVVGPRKSNDFGRGSVVLMQPIFWDERSAANADHIATFDPTTVLALLSRLEQAEQAVQRVRAKHAERVLVYPNGAEEHYCAAEENSAWPCDTIRALDGDGCRLADDALGGGEHG